jgi:hypothetical protein
VGDVVARLSEPAVQVVELLALLIAPERLSATPRAPHQTA